ncbi:MAG: rhodanese-related sulfurtransferase [Desulforhopalus sp.]
MIGRIGLANESIHRGGDMKYFASVLMTFCLIATAGFAFSYEDITPIEAISGIQEAGAFILDVRTPQEWNWVGHPGINGTGEGEYLDGKVVNVSYMVYHEGYSKGDVLIVNTHFIKDVKKILDADDPIITMCRSGGRSLNAAIALEAAGFTNVYNMLTGFEGEKDENNYRTVNGWKVDGHPYNFSGIGDYKD